MIWNEVMTIHLTVNKHLKPYSELDYHTLSTITSKGRHIHLKAGDIYNFNNGDVFVSGMMALVNE